MEVNRMHDGHGQWKAGVLVLLLGLWWACQGVPRAAGETSQVAVLVVTRAHERSVAREANSIVGHLLDLRWREGYTTRTLPVLTYDLDRSEEQAYCTSHLGVSAGDVPFVALVKLSADCVPGSIIQRVDAAGGAQERAAAAFSLMRRQCPPSRHASLPRSELAEMIYRLFVDLSPSELGSPQGQFSDVSPHDPDQAAIVFVAAQGLLRGYPDGTFRPQRPVNRYEVAVILDRVVATLARSRHESWPGGAPGTVRFTDVKPGAAELPSIQRLCAAGMMSGFPDGSFAGLRAATVSQVHASTLAVRKWFATHREP